MSLTTGRGPLSARPAGRFTAPVPAQVAYIEPFRRRVRAVAGGRTVVDSERVLLVHRQGRAPTYAFPAGDVTGAESVADFHILGSKPAADALILQICIEAFGEGVVLTRVADEAGVELEGLIEERGQIVNQGVWQTTASEKSQGERPGFGEGAMIEGAGTVMVTNL